MLAVCQPADPVVELPQRLFLFFLVPLRVPSTTRSGAVAACILFSSKAETRTRARCHAELEERG